MSPRHYGRRRRPRWIAHRMTVPRTPGGRPWFVVWRIALWRPTGGGWTHTIDGPPMIYVDALTRFGAREAKRVARRLSNAPHDVCRLPQLQRYALGVDPPPSISCWVTID